MYQLIIFDWDGTLMDSADKIANCMRSAAHSVGLEMPSVDQAKNIIGLGLSEAALSLFPGANVAQRKALLDAYRYQFVQADTTKQKLFDGVRQGLHELNQTGAFLAVATGKSRRGLDRALNDSQLREYFSVSRCADETRSKPHPQMLYEILEYTSIEASKSIMIGDTSYDLDMARNANMAGLGVSYGVHADEVLKKSGAITVEQDFKGVLKFLLDGRTEKAFS